MAAAGAGALVLAWHGSGTLLAARRQALCKRPPVAVLAAVWYILLLCLYELAVASSAMSSGFDPRFSALQPGHDPLAATASSPAVDPAAEIIDRWMRDPPQYAAEDHVHWREEEARCDCGLADRGARHGRCERLPGSEGLPQITVVSALVDVGRRFRSPREYLGMLLPNLRREVDLTFFGEAWALHFVKLARTRFGLANRTQYRLLLDPAATTAAAAQRDIATWGSPAPMAFYGLLPEMREAQRRNFIWHWLTSFSSGNGPKASPLYDWVNHQKVDWVLQEAEKQAEADGGGGGGGGRRYFVWVDAGAGHGHMEMARHFCPCNVALPGTVTLVKNVPPDTLMQRPTTTPAPGAGPRPGASSYGSFWEHFGVLGRPTPYSVPLETLSLDDYLRVHTWYHHMDEVIGTFWGGDLDGLRRYFHEYNRVLRRITAEGHLDSDQAIMSLVAAERPPFLRLLEGSFWFVDWLC